MKRPLFSQSWHSVAGLQPRLAPHARISRNRYRDQLWYVVQDQTSGRYHRISPAAFRFIDRMNGQRTVQILWDAMCQADATQIPTQDEVVELLMQLYTNDLLQCDVTPDVAEVYERYQKRRASKWKQYLANPLSLRLPVFDPDAFLTRWSPLVQRFFSVKGFLLWLAVVLPAIGLSIRYGSELTSNLSDRVLAADNLLILLLVFPAVKVLHELGHGFATKVWGGPVHEMGLMFLVFVPIPYVDASSAAAFPSRYRRAIVGAAGMMAELFLAALAVYTWVLVEPGIVRSLAFNVIFIAGISSLIVNGNPLLRFDAYYILSDLIGMPNLAQRGPRYLTYLCDTYLFGARDSTPPNESTRERRWLIFYTVASWFYRIAIMVSIILFVAGEFFIFGLLLALWGAGTLFVTPVWKSMRHILYSNALARHRTRAIRVTVGILAPLALFVAFVPVPLITLAEGVIWLPDHAQVRALEAGYFQQWMAKPGTRVAPGAAVVAMYNPSIETNLTIAEARVTEYETRFRVEQFSNPSAAAVLQQQLAHEQQGLHRARSLHERLLITGQSAGTFVVPVAQDMDGRYFFRGDLLGYILDREQFVARVVVEQDDIDLVRTRLHSIDLRFADAIPTVHRVQVLREIPGATEDLPSAALGIPGGGRIATHPAEPSNLKTLKRVFLIDLKLPANVTPSAFGERVYVRFNHQSEALAKQAYRRVRQLFLSRFHA